MFEQDLPLERENQLNLTVQEEKRGRVSAFQYSLLHKTQHQPTQRRLQHSMRVMGKKDSLNNRIAHQHKAVILPKVEAVFQFYSHNNVQQAERPSLQYNRQYIEIVFQ